VLETEAVVGSAAVACGCTAGLATRGAAGVPALCAGAVGALGAGGVGALGAGAVGALGAGAVGALGAAGVPALGEACGIGAGGAPGCCTTRGCPRAEDKPDTAAPLGPPPRAPADAGGEDIEYELEVTGTRLRTSLRLTTMTCRIIVRRTVLTTGAPAETRGTAASLPTGTAEPRFRCNRGTAKTGNRATGTENSGNGRATIAGGANSPSTERTSTAP
jgi:hypothetical protein